jgi:type VI secretion system secreted protein Hcp
MALYMKFGSIKGAVTTDGFKEWIELKSFQWAVNRDVGTAARGSTSREHSEPTLHEVTVTKLGDISSPKLLLDAVAGKLDNKVEIKFTTTTKGKVETFLGYEFTDAGVSHYSTNSVGDMPLETVQINFAKVSKTFTGHDPGIGGSPETVGYDLTQMKTV